MKKRVLVTGASTGIGYAISKQLMQNSYHVIAGVRKEQDFKRLNDLGCEAVYLDVTNEAQVLELVKKISQQGGLEALVNNAGIAVVGPVEAVPMQQLRQQMEVNFFSVYRLTQLCLPMLRASKGRIVNIGSISGVISAPLFTPYAASKYAIEALSDGLRRELLGMSVKVSLIEPGAVQTPIWQKSKNSNEEMLNEISEDLQRVYQKHIQALRDSVDEAERMAVPVEQVSQAVMRALTVRHPKARYVVGRPAKIISILRRFLPDAILDRIVKVV